MDIAWIYGLVGGLMIGLAASVYLLGLGRIMGASGIAGTLVDGSSGSRFAEQAAFLAGLIGVAQDGEAAGPAAARCVQAVRDLRAEVGIGDTSELIRREDFDYLTGNAISEGAFYPVPRLLDRDSVHDILGRIAA